MVRFLSVAFNPIESGLEKVSEKIDYSALNLGANKQTLLFKIHLPMIISSCLIAFLLIFIDILKELPITLILRPFNYNTLSVLTFEYASSEQLAQAALPALLITIIGLFPLLFIYKILNDREGKLMSIINLEKVSLTLNKLNILQDITFSLNKREVVSILGPSGSGKSSILRIIAGLIKPTEGYVYFSNKLISSNKSIVPTGQRNIGLMFQEDVLFPHLTVYKNIAFGLEQTSYKEKEKKVLHYLKEFNLLEKKN